VLRERYPGRNSVGHRSGHCPREDYGRGLAGDACFSGAGLSQVAFVAVLFAILATLVAFETSRNLRPDAHPAPEEDAVGEEPVVEEERA
jgi:hypothetical protein